MLGRYISDWFILDNLGLQYNALSFVFLQLRELSWLQWHPFSVSSSPLDGKHHMSILIKVLGKWTAKLRDTILNSSENQPETELLSELPSELTASVEGPYGHELPYHLMYSIHSSNRLNYWVISDLLFHHCANNIF